MDDELRAAIDALPKIDRVLIGSALRDTDNMVDDSCGHDPEGRRKVYRLLATLVDGLSHD